MLIWYLSATTRTSGKLTAAAAMSTTTCPSDGTGSGTSTTATLDGGP
ncbi:MAG: hypothetical protein ACRDWB_13930 [Acidimicrobiales bacterium]